MGKASTIVDVCVIGSGAGGGVLAKELSESGLRVAILEGGDSISQHASIMDAPDWELHIQEMFRPEPSRDRITLGEKSEPITLVRLKNIGGSTMRYEGFCPRPHPGDFRRLSQYGVGADWPLSFEELLPHFDRVESILQLSGTVDNPFEAPRSPYRNPPLEYSCAVKELKKGCEALGLHVAHAPLAILSRSAPGRAACNFCGGCWFGCHVGAISNMSLTYIPLARKQGVKILERSMAVRIVLKHGDHSVRGVEYLDPAQKLHFLPAKAVAVCGNSVETARLLLISQNNAFPQGLANSSGLVGRNFMMHTQVMLSGLLDRRVEAYKGPNINAMVQDYYDSDPRRDFIGGYLIALRNAELGPLTFCQRWAGKRFGHDLHQYMKDWFGHSVSIEAYGETLPNRENRVELDAEEKDCFGLPVPRVTMKFSENERKMLRHMEGVLRDILTASGGHEIQVLIPPSFLGTHLMGTCRMGHDPQSSVTNSYGQTHDLKNLFIADGSLFPTSTPTNPTLTIQALATRVAGHIVRCFIDKTLS